MLTGILTGGTIPFALPNKPVTRFPRAPPIAAACCIGVAVGCGVSMPCSAVREFSLLRLSYELIIPMNYVHQTPQPHLPLFLLSSIFCSRTASHSSSLETRRLILSAMDNSISSRPPPPPAAGAATPPGACSSCCSCIYGNKERCEAPEQRLLLDRKICFSASTDVYPSNLGDGPGVSAAMHVTSCIQE